MLSKNGGTFCLTAATFVALIAFSPTVVGTSFAPAPEPSEKELASWWADLERGDEEASRALLKLVENRNAAVAFLKKTMKPLKVDRDKVNDLLESLGSDKEAVWMAAFDELDYFDPRLAIDLETLMADVTQVPTRQRTVEVLSGWKPGSLAVQTIELRLGNDNAFYYFSKDSGSWWAEHKVSRINATTTGGNRRKKWTRSVRAIVLLEHIGTPEAVAVLTNMATGHPEAQPTIAAKAALKRIKGNTP
jgi:hypothetical protein